MLLEPGRLAGASLLRCQSDERLVDLARSGSDRAFDAIVERYRRPLLRYCRRFLPPDLAEDVLQQALANAHSSLHRGDAEIDLRPWLYRIVHNGCVSALRRGAGADAPLSEDLPARERVEDLVEDRERLRSAIAAIHELPDGQRRALVLRALEGRGHEEIAAELGVTGGAARQLLHRARTTLRAAASAVTPPFLLRGLLPQDAAASLGAAGLAGAGGATVAAKICATAAVVAGGIGAAAVLSPEHGGSDRTPAATVAPEVVRSHGGSPNGAARLGADEDGEARRGADGPGAAAPHDPARERDPTPAGAEREDGAARPAPDDDDRGDRDDGERGDDRDGVDDDASDPVGAGDEVGRERDPVRPGEAGPDEAGPDEADVDQAARGPDGALDQDAD